MTTKTSMQKPYDITKTFEENVVYGPLMDSDVPVSPKRKPTHTFLGHKVNSLFGVAASPMTFTARSIGIMAKLGYDIITYRSVRSMEWHGLGAPNWAYVDAPEELSLEQLSQPLTGNLDSCKNQAVTTANSFGVQSLKPEYWQLEYERANAYLSDGQLLILALMPSTEGDKDAVQDVAELAQLASETSAEIFEINLACPNSGSKALIYQDIETSVAVCRTIKEQIGNKKLLAKVGYFPDQHLLQKFMKETNTVIDGITSTNTYSAPVKTPSGEDIFPGRSVAGVSGNAIRHLSQAQSELIVQYKKELNLDNLAVIGLGGVMKPEHIQEYLDLGVDAVQAVTGVWANPLLAREYHELLKSN